MGLDQHWFKGRTKEQKLEDILVNGTDEFDVGELEEIAYHRKFHDLSQFIHQMFSKEFLNKEFNCACFELTEEQYEPIKNFIKNCSEEERRRYELAKLEEAAKEVFSENKTIIYHPWW